MGKKKDEFTEDELKDQIEYDECPQCHSKVKEFIRVRSKSYLTPDPFAYLLDGRKVEDAEEKYRCPYCGYILGEKVER
ncbi:MAG: hypothetical protein M1503_03990 [Thaumarchaeota archaeon]|nr:hypothetical protein [Nitrososphaerota archaeon]MCL5317414.1 hypothetical protein [Nitrososphaerota archaeon]